MVSSAELQLINDNSQPENDKDASGGDSPKVSPRQPQEGLVGCSIQKSVSLDLNREENDSYISFC